MTSRDLVVGPACDVGASSGVPESTGVVQIQNLAVRQFPRNSAVTVGRVPIGGRVVIQCTAIGQVVTRNLAKGTIATPVWDGVGRPGSVRKFGYIPDVWVDRGGLKPVAPRC